MPQCLPPGMHGTLPDTHKTFRAERNLDIGDKMSVDDSELLCISGPEARNETPLPFAFKGPVLEPER